MYIGDEAGCQDVPEPIAPIEVMFDSLEPTRMPMSSPSINRSGPISIRCVPSVSSIAGIGDGEAAGEAAGFDAGLGVGFGISCPWCWARHGRAVARIKKTALI